MSDLYLFFTVFLFLLLAGLSVLLCYMTGILKKINNQLAQPLPLIHQESRPANNAAKKNQQGRIISAPPAAIAAVPQNMPAELKMVSLKQTKGNRNHLINGALIDLKERELVELKIVVDKPISGN